MFEQERQNYKIELIRAFKLETLQERVNEFLKGRDTMEVYDTVFHHLPDRVKPYLVMITYTVNESSSD